MLIDFPHTLNIYLTSRCNLDCSYCFVSKDGTEDKEPDIEALKRAVDNFLGLVPGDKTISFTGGEPLLRFARIKALCRHLKARSNKDTSLSVTLTTNGTLLTKNRYSFLTKNNINFKVSIDGLKKNHEKNRPFKINNSGSSYNCIIANLEEALLSGDCKAGVSLVFAPNTAGSLVEYISAFWKMGFKRIDFHPDMFARWTGNDLDLMESSMGEFVDFYFSTLKGRGAAKGTLENSLLYNFLHNKNSFRPLSCGKINLGWDGNFYYCDKALSLPASGRREFIIGGAAGIDNRLRLKLLEQKRAQIRKVTGKDCRRCKYVRYCFCPIGHYIYFSSRGMNFKKYFPQFCRISRIYIRTFLAITRESNVPPRPLFSKVGISKTF